MNQHPAPQATPPATPKRRRLYAGTCHVSNLTATMQAQFTIYLNNTTGSQPAA